MKTFWKAALMAGAMGLFASFTSNFFILPVPETELANAIGNGISGFVSGFMGAVMVLKPKKAAKADAQAQ